MDKRQWPWKKKVGDRNSVSTNAEDGSYLRHSNDQDAIGSRSVIVHTSDATCSQDQTNEKTRILNERLLAADQLVKQHARVAEEAVSGWERSKDENLSLKRRLEQLIEENLASNDQISQLNQAIKETTWQLRQTREEQDQMIHDIIVKKRSDWENLKIELEQRLEDADHQLIEAEAQNSLLFKHAKEQADAILQLGQACSDSEAKFERLQARFDVFENENSSLRYELTIRNNELAIRNQERDINQRSLDVARRQKAESARRISKLEIECQRLRALVRKKLPGSGTIMHMKLKADNLDDERQDFKQKWRQGSKAIALPRAVESVMSLEASISEQSSAMEEETKILREIFAKRKPELQTTRTVSAQMAEMLSALERQKFSQAQNLPRTSLLGYGIHRVDSCVSLSSYKEPSHASPSEDGADDEHSVADSFASAMISELACFSKDRLTSNLQEPRLSNKFCNCLDSIDDFIEVERLVSLDNKQREQLTVSIEAFAAKEVELQSANAHLAELEAKLVLVNDQLTNASTKNAALEIKLSELQCKFNIIIANLEQGDEAGAMEEIRNLVLDSHCSSVDGPQGEMMELCKASYSVNLARLLEGQRSLLPLPDEGSVTKSELKGAINEVISLVEELAHNIEVQQRTCHCKDCRCADCAHFTRTRNTSELDCKLENLKSSANNFLEGYLELAKGMRELSSVLNLIIKAQPVSCLNPCEKENYRQASEQDVLSDAGSPFSKRSNCDSCALPPVQALPADQSSSASRESPVDKEVQKLCAEKAILESDLKAQLARLHEVETMLAQVQDEKSQLVVTLEEEREKLEATQSRLVDEEQLIVNLRVRLAALEHSKHMADEKVSEATSENSKLVLRLQECQAELTKSNEVVCSLERSIVEKQERNDDLRGKMEQLQCLLEREVMDKPDMRIVHNADKDIKKGITSAMEESIASARNSSSLDSLSYGRQESALSKGKSEKDVDGSFATSSSCKDSICCDAGDFVLLDANDDELVSCAERTNNTGKNLNTHEANMEAVFQQLPVSPKLEPITQIVCYVPQGEQSAACPEGSECDLAKSRNLGSSAFPKRGNVLSKFFMRNKRGPS